MRAAYSFLLGAALAIVAGGTTATAQNAPPRDGLDGPHIAAIAALARREMARQHIAGMAIGVGFHGTLIYARGFGTRDGRKPVDENTVFPIGSITKQFTAACVMLLVQQGRVQLDQPIARYISDAPHARDVTVRELLEQTSGLADYSSQPALQSAIGPKRLVELSPAKLIGMIADKPLEFKPGTKFEYSNTNYVLAGMIVQAVSGETYPAFLRKHVIAPLGLQHTQYLRTSIPDGPDVSRGYKVTKDHFVLLPPFTMSWAGAAGALASDVHDLILWDRAFFGGRVIGPALVRTMTTVPTLRVPSDYAFGWVRDQVNGQRMIWHNGALPGAHAMNAVFPDSGWEIVVLTNVLTASPEDIAKEVLATLPVRHRSVALRSRSAGVWRGD